MRDDLDRLIDELAEERPGLRARVESAVARRVEASITRRVLTERLGGAGLSVRDAAALLGITPAGLKLHDGRLKPTRDSSGRRTYDRAAVLALARERARARPQDRAAAARPR